MLANLVKLYQDVPLSISHLLFIPLGFIGIYRWFQFIIKFTAYLLYRPIRPQFDGRKYSPSKDVTVIVPTIDHDIRFFQALKTWLACDPYEVIIVTIPSVMPLLNKMALDADPSGKKVRVLTVPKGNKRKQMVAGANACKTALIIYCDDDVLWPNTMLDWIIAPFEDERVGGVGTTQTAIPDGNFFTIWETLANIRLSMRNIEILATTFIDGGISCLSGRTAAYRAAMVQDAKFQEAFLEDYWLNKYHLHSGDDKFLTRWCQTHNWKTHAQGCAEVELVTTFKPDYKFLIQLLRWTRNTWRSDIRALFFERALWSSSPYTAYTMFDRLVNPLTMVYGVSYFVYRVAQPISTHIPQVDIAMTYFLWYVMVRLVKYLPHLLRRPIDLLALPIFVGFQYFFICMKIYCLFTLHVTEWGTRAGADDAHAKVEVVKDAASKSDTPSMNSPLINIIPGNTRRKTVDIELGIRKRINTA